MKKSLVSYCKQKWNYCCDENLKNSSDSKSASRILKTMHNLQPIPLFELLSQNYFKKNPKSGAFLMIPGFLLL